MDISGIFMGINDGIKFPKTYSRDILGITQLLIFGYGISHSQSRAPAPLLLRWVGLVHRTMFSEGDDRPELDLWRKGLEET